MTLENAPIPIPSVNANVQADAEARCGHGLRMFLLFLLIANLGCFFFLVLRTWELNPHFEYFSVSLTCVIKMLKETHLQ